tara:strand:- start:543 stop:1103 length:561 start_codon:yes stop_codon:yes gene_type:complete
MEPEEPQLVGTPQPQPIIIDPHTGLPQNVIIIQQPSSASKVVGILAIIWGVLNLGGEAYSLGDTLAIGGLFVGFSAINVLIYGGFIAGGVMMTSYKKKGVQICLLMVVLSAIMSLALIAFVPEIIDSAVEDGDLTDDEAEALEGFSGALVGVGIAVSVICNGICGLIVAIPLMVSNNGLDDSSLIG